MASQILPAPNLIGRAAECGMVLRQLHAPGQRLVTLVGPGGIGKTSLALQIAASLAASADSLFADGVVIVPLAPVAKAADAALAIAEAAGAAPQGARPMADQLIGALSERSLLLVLDNLEHLLGTEGQALATLIRRILDEAPGVRILTTSRERLKLRDERIVELGGLALPADDSPARVDGSAAVQLFVERAQRVAPEFALQAHNRAAVAHICRRLEGLPLAIELAAAWARVLAPQEIADEIDRSLSFLAHADRDTVPRHRSIRAALDHSWQLLGEAERRTLARLSVFHGGCDREAAIQVAHAALPAIGALIDKSLLRREDMRGVTRYTLHELVRQYAAEQLAADPHEQAATERRHTGYYAGLLQRLVDGRTGAIAPTARATLNREVDNLRAAWSRAAMGDTAALAAMLRGLWVLYEANSWLLDGAATFGQAADALRADPAAAALRGALLVQQASFLARVGRFDLAAPLLHEGMALARANMPPEELSGLTYNLAMIELNRGQIAVARDLLAQAAAAAQDTGDQYVGLWAELFLGWVARFYGDYAAAEAFYQRCLSGWRAQGFARGEAAALAYLGDLARVQGQFATAGPLLGAGMRIASAANDRWTLSLTLAVLGGLAVDQGEWDEARYLLAEGVSTIRDLGAELWMLGAMLCGQGYLARSRGALRDAQQRYAEVVPLVRSGAAILTGELVYGMARVFERAGDDITALGLLLALEGVAAEHHIAAQAARWRGSLEARMTADQRAAADALAQRPLLALLDELCARPLAQPAPSQPPAQPADEPIVPPGGLYIAETGEVLSAREVEVLRLLAGGASNQAIADTLVISRFTAKNHVASILQKLAVDSRMQAALRARRLGLEPLTPP